MMTFLPPLFFLFIAATADFTSPRDDLTVYFSSCSNESSTEKFVLRAILSKQGNTFATLDFLPNGRLNANGQQLQWRPTDLNLIKFSNGLSANESLSLQVNDARVELDRLVNLTDVRLQLQINQLIGGCVQFDDFRATLDNERSAATVAVNQSGFLCVGRQVVPCGTCRWRFDGLSPVASVGYVGEATPCFLGS